MALTKERRTQIVEKFKQSPADTGSVEIQVALITDEITNLNDHLKIHRHDFHSRRGLFQKIGHRRKLLKYLQKTDELRYKNLIQALGLRR
ncbi:MAG: 30S ribosomal protein S15 [Acholeplasmatales bacterium]|jgi:small subunit ribosomal protein S15|nr:30S ribosomal protein S15 [Acholeplasmatales bacterium]